METAQAVKSLADTAHSGVLAVGTPIVALAVALLVLTIAIGVIAHLMHRTPKD